MSRPLCHKQTPVFYRTSEIAQICYNMGHACFDKDRFIPQLDVINLSAVWGNTTKLRESGNGSVVLKRRAWQKLSPLDTDYTSANIAAAAAAARGMQTSLMPMQVQRSLLSKHANNTSLIQNVWHLLNPNIRLTSDFQVCIHMAWYYINSN